MMIGVIGRVGAYLLPGDPVWLRSSLARYYHLLDDLVVLVPEDGLGWNGYPLPVEECLAAVAEIDTRRLARQLPGVWRDVRRPMMAETAQRQAGIDALSSTVDWILQVDNDEVLPDPDSLLAIVAEAGDDVGVEWPMNILYRKLRGGRYLRVVGVQGQPVYDYPGSVIVRSGTRLTEARRHEGGFTRVTVRGDDASLQVTRPPEDREHRKAGIDPSLAIVHNSWARSPSQVWRKTRSWGHASGLRGVVYYLAHWLPAPLTWRWARDFHPFARGLWPRLGVVRFPSGLLVPTDDLTRSAWRTRARS